MPMWNVYASPVKDRNAAEFVEASHTSVEAGAIRDYVTSRLPNGEVAWVEWAERRTTAPDFDCSRLREAAKIWPKGEDGPAIPRD